MSAEDPLRDAPPDYPDYCDRSGAFRLKLKIEAYWRERGHIVTITLKDSSFHPAIRASRYDLRSDMRNGLPAEVSAQSVAA